MSGPVVSGDTVATVLEALGPRPRTKAAIAIATGIPARHVEAAIEHARRESLALVCSSGEGYWTPATLAEAEENIERRHRRAIRQLETLAGERTLIRRMREGVDLTLFGADPGRAA